MTSFFSMQWLRRTRKPTTPGSEAPAMGASRKTWANSSATVDRSVPGKIAWQLTVPMPHTSEYHMVQNPGTVSITILRSGAGLKNADPQNVYRRVLPLLPEMQREPTVTLENHVIRIEFSLATTADTIEMNSKPWVCTRDMIGPQRLSDRQSSLNVDTRCDFPAAGRV